MGLKFTKMHGLGNDFVVIDGVRQRVALTAEDVRRIADRHFGVGCDQLLLVEPPSHADVDFTYRIFNADGGEVEQCGNGARCFARFVHERGLSAKPVLRVATKAGVLELAHEDGDRVRVAMGVPEFEPARIPFTAPRRRDAYPLDIDGVVIEAGVVALGNPHAVLRVDDVERAPVADLGPRIECDACFPARVNVGFMQVVARDHIRLRVHERGAGETLACGSGACAAVVMGRVWGLLDERVNVALPGGMLVVSWPGDGEPVFLSGPAVRVFEGELMP